MIVHLKGVLEEKTPYSVVIDAGGVGYGVLIPLSTYDRLPACGEKVSILTYHEVKEDSQSLYGFATKQEREMFTLLLRISGIGAKTALSFLSGMTVGELQLAISSGDAKRLSSIKGIGKKTAERICVELKDKINPIEALAAGGGEKSADGKRAGILRDAILALTALGFAEEAARKMVQSVLDAEPDIAGTEEILRRALKQ